MRLLTLRLEAAATVFFEKKVAHRGAIHWDGALQPVNTPAPAFAVIDGSLCQLGRSGGRAIWHQPLATAVVEFRRGPLCTYVREHPFGLLPGIANLYCLDGAHRLQWIAEWPSAEDRCAQIVEERDGILIAKSASGAEVQLEAATGRLLRWTHAMARVG